MTASPTPSTPPTTSPVLPGPTSPGRTSPGRTSPSSASAVAAVALVVAVAAAAPFPGVAVVLVGVAGVALVLLLPRGVAVGRWSVPLLVLALLAWVWASTAWSGAPLATVRAATATTLLAALAACLGSTLRFDDAVAGVARGLQAVVAASWLLFAALPAVGRAQGSYQAGSLEGVFVHRNIAGFVGVLAVVTFGLLAASDRERPWRHAAWGAVSLALVVASSSGTAVTVLAVLAAVLLLVVLVRRSRVRSRGAVVLLALGGTAALVAWVLVAHSSVLLLLLGRDATLTGRTVIWEAVLTAVRERPLTGYGWGSLWQGNDGPTRDMWAQAGFAFFHAHNGYLDTTVQVGLVGTGLLALLLVGTLRQAMLLALDGPSPLSLWPLLVLVTVATYNVTETVLSVYAGFFLLTLSAVGLPLWSAARRSRAAGGPLTDRTRKAPSWS